MRGIVARDVLVVMGDGRVGRGRQSKLRSFLILCHSQIIHRDGYAYFNWIGRSGFAASLWALLSM